MKTTLACIFLIAIFTFHLSAQENKDEPKPDEKSEAFKNQKWYQENFSDEIQDKMDEFAKRLRENLDSYEDDFGAHFRFNPSDTKKFEELFKDFKIQYDDLDITIDSIEHFFKGKQFNMDNFDVQKFHFNPLNEELIEKFEDDIKRYFEDEEFQEKINKFKQSHKHQIEELLEEMKEYKNTTKKAI